MSASIAIPEAAETLLILAHGAGAGMEHPFMQTVQERIATRGFAVALFNFPYVENGKRAPDRGPTLERCWVAVADQLRTLPAVGAAKVYVGGKSMGGRIASQMVAAGYQSDGVLLLGYPLHPPGKPERLRRQHLPAISAPMLFIQGTRDPLCGLDLLRREVAGLERAKLHVIEGGDHSFKVRKRDGRNSDQVFDEIADTCCEWLARPEK